MYVFYKKLIFIFSCHLTLISLHLSLSFTHIDIDIQVKDKNILSPAWLHLFFDLCLKIFFYAWPGLPLLPLSFAFTFSFPHLSFPFNLLCTLWLCVSSLCFYSFKHINELTYSSFINLDLFCGEGNCGKSFEEFSLCVFIIFV